MSSIKSSGCPQLNQNEFLLIGIAHHAERKEARLKIDERGRRIEAGRIEAVGL